MSEPLERLKSVAPCDTDGGLGADVEWAVAEIERLRINWLTEQKARLEQADLLKIYEAVKAKREIERLEAIVDRLLSGINAVGCGLFGPGGRWREAGASWWQELRKAVEAAEAAGGES